jgi:hypothetical protein
MSQPRSPMAAGEGSLLMIALDVVVILALTVHGSDIKPYRGR